MLAACAAVHEREGLTEDDYLARLADALCQYSIRCDGRLGLIGGCNVGVRYDGVPGRYRCVGDVFNPDAAQLCLDLLTSSCGLGPASCFGVYGPPAPAGSTCRPASCPADQYCGPDVGCVGSACPMHCQPRAQNGGACADGSEGCAAGLECVTEGATALCRPRTHSGAPCRAATPACSAPMECRGGLCVGWGDAVGADCAFAAGYAGCIGDLVCIGDSVHATCQFGAAIGEPCVSDPFCAVATPSGCAAPLCALGLRCVDGACVQVVMPGGVCATDAVCARDLRCAAGRCVARPVIGDPCSADVACATGACRENVCTGLAPGDACISGSTTSSPCAAGSCTRGTCPPVVSEGGSCPTDLFTVCATGTTCNTFSGTCVPLEQQYCGR
jgi:hypothetical protein